MAGRYPNPGVPTPRSQQPYSQQPAAQPGPMNQGHSARQPQFPGQASVPHPPTMNQSSYPQARRGLPSNHAAPQSIPPRPQQLYSQPAAQHQPGAPFRHQGEPVRQNGARQFHPQDPQRTLSAQHEQLGQTGSLRAHPQPNGTVSAGQAAQTNMQTPGAQIPMRPIPGSMRPAPLPRASAPGVATFGAPARPIPAEASRVHPPAIGSLTASMGAASIGGKTNYGGLPNQFGAHAPQPAPVADPNFLPRPVFSSEAMTTRIAQGDPVIALPKEEMRPGIPGHIPSHEPVACSPDVFIPASSRNIRLCSGAFPASLSLAKKYSLPLGAVIQPLADPAPSEPHIPVVNFGATGIVRCRRCRTYVNFSCRFTDGGRRWTCSMCQYPNDCPSDYFSPLDELGRRRDAAQRPELHRGSIEFVAPAEYMVRPPMPPIFLFVLEVTSTAMSCGALSAMISGIRASIDSMPNEGRTRVGIITFDTCVSFYTLPSGADADPSISVVADINDMFIPTPDNILAQLSDCRPAFEKALDVLHTGAKAVQGSQQVAKPVSSASCLGAALQGAQKVMEHYGGKMMVLASSRPTSGPGALRDRAENNSLGTERERAVLRPESTFYRQMAVEFSKYQISCDLFLCPPPPAVFMDVGTVAQLAKFTGGDLFRTAGFEAHKDHPKLQRSVYRSLTRVTGFEAVMRVRASKSVRCSQFHGRFFVRSTDLLAMPNVDSDKAYAVQFSFDESTLSDGPFCVQVALLYTTTSGERRIRVHTVAIPVTNSISDLFCRVDASAVANVYLRMAAEAVKDRAINELKKTLSDKVVTGLSSYRMVCQQQYQGMGGPAGLGGGAAASQLFLPDAMNLLPLYMHGLFRSAILSHETAAASYMRFDDKSTLIHDVDTMNIALSTALLYPNMIPVLPPSLGVRGPSEGIVIPVGSPASTSSLKTDIALLVDDGRSLVLWLGTSLVPSFASELLGVPPQSISANVDVRQLAYCLMQPVERKGSVAFVRSVVTAVLGMRPAGTDFQVVIAGSPMQSRVQSMCVEDRTSSSIGYKEYLLEISRQVVAKAGPMKT